MLTTTRLLPTLLAAVVAACAAAPEGPGGPGDLPTAAPATPGEPGATPQRVEPTPGMEEVHPVPWEEHAASGDGTAVEVRWWSGVAPCTVLDRIEVAEDATTVTITLFEGSDPAEPDAVCPMIAVYKAAEVSLDRPLGDRDVVDGAR